MNQTEIDELRRLHEAATPGEWQYDDGVTDGEGTADAERGKPAWITAKGNVLIAEPTGDEDNASACTPSLTKMDANGRCIVAARNAIPRLLAALEEARAERDRMRDVLLRKNFAPCDTQACNCGGWHERSTGDGSYARFREIDEAIGDHNGKTLLAAVVEMVQERDALKARLYPKPCGGCPGCGTGDCVDAVDAAETLAWDALGRPEGTHDTTNVQRLCEAHGALKAKMADAEAERSEARSLLLNGIQTNGDSLAFLEHVRREHAAVVAERDAIKATLAKHMESERAWCELATERGAKVQP